MHVLVTAKERRTLEAAGGVMYVGAQTRAPELRVCRALHTLGSINTGPQLVAASTQSLRHADVFAAANLMGLSPRMVSSCVNRLHLCSGTFVHSLLYAALASPVLRQLKGLLLCKTAEGTIQDGTDGPLHSSVGSIDALAILHASLPRDLASSMIAA